jgi:hypothetical protein
MRNATRPSRTIPSTLLLLPLGLLITGLLPGVGAGQDSNTEGDPEPTVLVPQAEEPRTDAWGADRRFGLAVSEIFLTNFAAWAFNEFPRNAAFSQVNPRSWWYNIEQGFQWDDNHFSTNHFAHPYQGAMYFNAFRSNGFNFWESSPAAFAGSFLWECCGETHLMSLNDLINTGMGGIALGEMLYRTSSMVLDNTSSGSSRVGKEIAGFFINPVRGATRLITGRAGEVAPNPEHPSDRRPDILFTTLTTGYRAINPEVTTDDPQHGAFFELGVQFGSPFELDRSQPFDFFELRADINTGDVKALGRLQVTGNLYHTVLGDPYESKHRFLVFQNFDYFNNLAYEFGGQSVSAAILSLWPVGESGRWNLFTSLDGYLMPMGAVNADFSFLAEVPGVRENLRSYDFGVGAGARGGLKVVREGRRIFELSYRGTYLNTLNGSVTNGSDAQHFVQMGFARGQVPIGPNWGLGADLTFFIRDSFYSLEELEDTRQRSPQFRAYATWTAGSRQAPN